jgi:2-polyprenyl-6-hydroxyphenyl methylase/3-demethylubiquinone-9 3-methyltransferase
MWQTLENVAPLVKSGVTLFIAIYNDQGKRSRQWRSIKRTYNHLPENFRFLVLWPAFLKMGWKRLLKDALVRPAAVFLSELQGS